MVSYGFSQLINRAAGSNDIRLLLFFFLSSPRETEFLKKEEELKKALDEKEKQHVEHVERLKERVKIKGKSDSCVGAELLQQGAQFHS